MQRLKQHGLASLCPWRLSLAVPQYWPHPLATHKLLAIPHGCLKNAHVPAALFLGRGTNRPLDTCCANICSGTTARSCPGATTNFTTSKLLKMCETAHSRSRLRNARARCSSTTMTGNKHTAARIQKKTHMRQPGACSS